MTNGHPNGHAPNGPGAPPNGAPNGPGPGGQGPNGQSPNGHGPSGQGPDGRPRHGASDGHPRNGSAPAPAGRPLSGNGTGTFGPTGPTNGTGTFGPAGPTGPTNGRPPGDVRRPGPGHPDAAFAGGPRRPEAAHRGPVAEPGGGARALPPPAQVPPGPPPVPRHGGEPRPPQVAGSAERTAAIRPSGPPPGHGGPGPDGHPTDVLPVDGGRPAARPDEARDPDATEVINGVVRDGAGPAAGPAAEPAADPSAVDEPDPDDDPEGGRSRRARRRSGDTAGSRPAADYKKQADALTRKKPRTGRRRRPAFWRELPLLVVVALLLTFLIQTFLAKVYVIPSGSMELTLHGCAGCNNDRVLVDKVTYRFTDPGAGDVVVFRGPDSWSSEVKVAPPGNALAAGLQQLGSLIGIAPPDEKDFVKRIIAVGGQTVQCCDSRNRVLVDGQPLEEPYVYYLPDVGPPRQEPFGPITVPAGQLWMMGDSRNNSSDSRVPGHGPVPVDNIIGKARLIVLPIDRFGWIEATNPQGAAAVGLGGATDGGVPMALGALLAVPLLWRGRRSSAAQVDPHDGFSGFLPDRRRWR